MNLSNLAKIILINSMIITLCSCSKSKPNSLNAIPEDVNLVYSVDLGAILKKMNLVDFSDSKFLKDIKKEVRNKNRKLYKVIDNIIEDPSMLGANLNQKMFIYFIEESKDEKYFCISIDLNDENIFKDFCDDLISTLDLEVDLEEELNYKYYIFEEFIGVGWDENKALLVFPDNYASRENLDFELEHLMTLREKDNITNSDLFDKFYSEGKDVSLLLSSNLFETYRNFQQLENFYKFDLEDNTLISHLEFSQEEILLTNEFLFNEEIKDFITEYNVWNNKINLEMLKFLPQESFLLASLSFNPSEYYESLKEEEEFSSINSGFEREFGFQLEDLFNTTIGNCVFSLNDFKEIEYTYTEMDYVYNPNKYGYEGGYEYVENEKITKQVLPIYNFIMEISDNSLFEEIIENYINENKVTKKGNYYEVKVVDKYSVYIAFNDKYLFVSNDKKSINSFRKDGYANSFQQSDLKGNILENNFYANLNLDYNQYPKNIKKEIRKQQNKKDKKIFKIFTDLLKNSSIKQTGNNNIEFIIGLKNSDVSSLNTILKTVENNYDLLIETEPI